jgi:hypothetical protein
MGRRLLLQGDSGPSSLGRTPGERARLLLPTLYMSPSLARLQRQPLRRIIFESVPVTIAESRSAHNSKASRFSFPYSYC